MADIVTPMTTAMKARAKAAAEFYRPEIELSARVDKVTRVVDGEVEIVTLGQDAVYGPDPDWVANFTPRQYRAMVRNGSNDAELKAEGWLEPGTIAADVSRLETGVRVTSFRPESNIPVRLP